MALFVVSLLMVSLVSASQDDGGRIVEDSEDHRYDVVDSLYFKSVEINGDKVGINEVLSVEEGQKINIHVGIAATENVNDIEVEAKISGYEYSDFEQLYDATELDNIDAGTTEYFDLDVNLPTRLDKDVYWLRLRVLSKHSVAEERVIALNIEPKRHALDIADVQLSPYGNSIQAGRSLIVDVLLENYGEKDEEDVIVTAEIPALGVRNSNTVDLIRTDDHNVDYEDVEGLFLPIPPTAAEGDYELRITARYDDLRDVVTKTMTIHVTPNSRFQADTGKLVLAVGPEAQTVAAGQTGTYAVALTNAGTSSKAYLLEAVAGNSLAVDVSEGLVVLEPGRNKVVYVQVTPAAGTPAGEQIVSLAIKSSDNNVLETISLRTIVTQGEAQTSTNLRTVLEVALIILVVLLVIIGLIIGFSRLKKDDNMEDEQTYY